MAYPYLTSPYHTEDEFRRWLGDDVIVATNTASDLTFQLVPSTSENPRMEVTAHPSVSLSTELYSATKCYTPKKIIRNGPATIVMWPDNTKTVVKCADGETDNTYSAFCAALAIKIFGSNSKAKKTVKKLTEEQK